MSKINIFIIPNSPKKIGKRKRNLVSFMDLTPRAHTTRTRQYKYQHITSQVKLGFVGEQLCYINCIFSSDLCDDDVDNKDIGEKLTLH